MPGVSVAGGAAEGSVGVGVVDGVLLGGETVPPMMGGVSTAVGVSVGVAVTVVPVDSPISMLKEKASPKKVYASQEWQPAHVSYETWKTNCAVPVCAA